MWQQTWNFSQSFFFFIRLLDFFGRSFFFRSHWIRWFFLCAIFPCRPLTISFFILWSDAPESVSDEMEKIYNDRISSASYFFLFSFAKFRRTIDDYSSNRFLSLSLCVCARFRFSSSVCSFSTECLGTYHWIRWPMRLPWLQRMVHRLGFVLIMVPVL